MAKRHPLHSICPYFAMFPEEFVERHVMAYTSPNDLVYDPFSGRGTTVFQSLLMGRKAAGSDINPVAVCISGAKANPPNLLDVLSRISRLESSMAGFYHEPPSSFFEACFSERTLQQVLFLRSMLDWRKSQVDRFIAAMTLGSLHGESHKSAMYLSNRMPRTISTKPDYSVRWWAERGLVAPHRDAFAVLRSLAKFRLQDDGLSDFGNIRLGDARHVHDQHAAFKGMVKLVVTSPPYLDMTDYAEDQWLRLWFLGGDPQPRARLHKDDRHTNAESYWQFLKEVWASLGQLLMPQATIVIRIGGALSKESLAANLEESITSALVGRQITLQGEASTTVIRKRQTNNFRPGTKGGVEHDFIFSVA